MKKRILVHVHLYYLQMWPEIKQKLENITSEYKLIVTLVSADSQIEQAIVNFKSDAEILIVENKGFDIWPFIKIVQQTNLDDYDYIIKLHTKRDVKMGIIQNGFDVSGEKWRQYLLSFLKDKASFEKCLTAFEQDKSLGMVGNYHVILRNDKNNQDTIELARKLLAQLKLKTEDISYVQGTMFMARAKLFDVLQNLEIGVHDFPLSRHDTKNFLPYAFEVLFGWLVTAQGYCIKDVVNSRFEQILGRIWAVFSRFVYRKKIDGKGRVIVKFCKIPVYRR